MSGDVIYEAGLDEAGRGPLAGPVVASCVILPKDFDITILGDSKALSSKKRKIAEEKIKKEAIWGIGIVSHDIIDKINILQASLKAMAIAYQNMMRGMPLNIFEEVPTDKNISAIVDGTFRPQIPCAVRAEVKADSKYPSVMAASILAKEERDRIMTSYDALYPQYGYAKHKGYPTKAHRKALEVFGPSPIQRLSFSYKKV